MTKDQCKQLVIDIISDIAPDEDLSNLKPDVRLRDQLQLDSMDFLNLVTALHVRLGIPIPEVDYPSLAKFGGAVDYLAEKVAGNAGHLAVSAKET